VAADGQNVHPVTVDEFRLGVAETLDVLVEPRGADAFTIFAQSTDRSGYARGTLAVQHGLTAPVPKLDDVVYLAMADMGHGASGGAHAAYDSSAAAHGDHGPAADGQGHAATGGHVTYREAAEAPVSRGAVTHPPTERRNPLVDMQTAGPASRLDDPGVGLRGNGRRVLTYADLKTLADDPDGREPGRTIELHLTGHMERYVWSFDGVPFSRAE